MANYYSTGDNSLINRLLNVAYSYEVGFSSSIIKPNNLKEFISTEVNSMRIIGALEKPNETQLTISANTSGFSINETFKCKWCGVIIIQNSADLELLSIEPMVEDLTPTSIVSLVHTYTLNFKK